ncbi:hypothetical protein AGDE_08635 [Angomonas deanei]|nr:hypothetical protein AGDE_08635 [Angomonas deanei]|eukprot:EPY32498.1 hypothetical protein AGDE_08635 [Angomonas deanei]
MLRLDKTCKLEVVQILSTPVTMPRGTPSTIVTVRDRLAPNGVLDVGNISQRGGLTGAPASSSSSSAGARRTVFVFDNAVGGSHVGQSVGELGRQNTRHQQELLKRQRVEEDSFLLNATNLNYATASDIRRREPLLEQHANREEKAVERIKKKAPVSTACLICKLDLENEEETLGTVEYFLSRHSTKQGCTMPTLEVLKNSLCDQRPDKKGKRLYCTSRFVDQQSKTVHLVHPRCVHLCTQYQRGDRLEDVLQLEANLTSCTLCGQLGATVKCYHPKCDRTFHVVCALFSNGYVNFGDRDPFLPCPACPSHTHVPMNAKAAKNVVVGSNASVFEDNIAFDSRVVDASDLRDPDEGDGW